MLGYKVEGYYVAHFLIGPLDVNGAWFCEDQKEKHHKDTYSKRLDHVFPNISNSPTTNNEHNWEDLCIQLRNQQACTSNNPN